ncbi:MAG TPA: hypothetical protein VNI02_19075 [Blastocatellia bacterium]|nr:hypothetical protein [Blastocatellia bacterium]
MLRKNVIAGAILLSIVAAAHGQGLRAEMKGYELYSWKSKGRWHYSLLVGTNRSKTYEEIMLNKVVRIGDAALKSELKRLPRGEEVSWMSDAPANIEKPKSGQWIDLKMPSRRRIKSIKAYCDKLGIKLKLV